MSLASPSGVDVGGGIGALATAVDVFTGAAVAADNNNAVGAVVPLSLTNDKDAYINTSVAFEGMCVGAFTYSAGKSAAASALLPPRCHRCAVRRCHALSCRHRRHCRCRCRHRRAAAKLPPPSCCPAATTAADAATASALPPSRCAPPPRFALLPLPLLLLPPLCRRQASADVALARCCHR